MQFRKIAAVAGTALMAVTMTAGAAIAATNVGNIASLATPSDSVANFPIFVIGKTAASEDVAGAIDIAVRMAAESKTTTSVTTTTGAAGTVTGTEKDTIGTNSALNSVLPSTATTTHFSGLKQGTVTWKGNTYDYYEAVTLGSTMLMSHDYGTSNINGTEKLQVPKDQYVYEYVFNKVLNMTDGATTTKLTGTLSNPEYSNPIKIKMLGKDFTIVGIGSSSIKLLSGSTGTATKATTSSTGLASTDGAYIAYVTAGVDSTWATIQLKDKNGNIVDASQSINKGDSKTFSTAGLDIQVTAVRVSGTDPTTQYIEADLVVGASGTTTKTLTTSCDISATGSSDTKFPGETKWCMQIGNNKVTGTSSFASVGTAAQGDVIQVVYKPSSTEFYKAGEKVSLPNNYGELGFIGWNTDSFVTLTASTVTGITGYNISNTDQSFGNLNGIKITTDVAGSIVDPVTKTAYTTVYALLNYTMGTRDTAAANSPVMIGLYDPVKQKILLNFTAVPTPTFSGATGLGYYKLLTSNTSETGGTTNYSSKFNYWFNISSRGAAAIADQQILNISFAGNATEGIGGSSWIDQFTIGGVGVGQNGNAVSMTWMNKSATWSTTTAPEFRLSTSDSADDQDVYVMTTPPSGTSASQTIGKATQDVVTDSGAIVSNAASNSGSQQVVVMVPAKTLYVKAYFGKMGAVTTTGATTTTVIPITTDVVKLDTEITDMDKTNNNLVIMGSPAVNMLAYQLLVPADKKTANPFPVYGYKWAEVGVPIEQNKAIVRVVQNAFATGKVAVIVAGWEAANTDTAALAIQSGKLAGNNATSVTIGGTDLNTLQIS